MVATDTVVGVTGAILLAAVMVGVFVYEYNNTPSNGLGGGPDDARKAAFASAYPSLNATDDMDGDGQANYADSDMDGNGVPDAQQAGPLAYSKPVAGQTSQPAAPAERHDMTFPVAHGQTRFAAVVNYTTQVSDPLGALPALPSLSMKLVAPDGKDAATATYSRSGDTVTMRLGPDSIGPLAPGNYTLRIEVAQGGPQTSYTGSFTVTYVAAGAVPGNS